MSVLIWELAQNNVKAIPEDRFGTWPVLSVNSWFCNKYTYIIIIMLMQNNIILNNQPRTNHRILHYSH